MRAARFTMIEMIMVIAVILILIALMFPGLMRSKELAFSAECVSHQRQLLAALSRHKLNADGFLPNPASWMDYVAGQGSDLDRLLICPKGGGFTENIEVEDLPPSLKYHKVEDSLKMRAYKEKSEFALPKNQAVEITASGTYSKTFKSSAGSIPKGTLVDVYLFHYDPKPRLGILHNAEFTFGGEVLGIIVTTAALNKTDKTFGEVSTTYPKRRWRGFETRQDIITLSSDMQTVNFDYLWTTGAIEQARVITTANAGMASYGMNNLVSTKHWPRPGQLLLVDYNKGMVDIDGLASDDVLGEEIAWRHLGKANGAFADGSVQSALTFSDLAEDAALWQP